MAKINLVYLCGPIDMDTEHRGKPWREEAAVYLKRIGVSSFSPTHAFNWCSGDNIAAEKMYIINRQVIKYSDAVLVYLNPEIHTVGSYMEVQQAVDYNKHIIIFSSNINKTRNKFAYLAQIPQFDSIHEATEYIRWINQQE